MSIRIENLAVDLGSFHLQNINLNLAAGDFFALMGPTGAGKSVLLEALVGLVPLASGEIFIGDRKITNLAPEERGISIVYQDYALFPHLTVLGNIRYGLRFKARKQSAAAVDELVSILGLGHLLKRYPANLSGGEQQRVALARALAVNPDILLLDEPLSALDPNFRQDLRLHLKSLHELSGATFLMVTHDFSEALSLARHAGVMHAGVIEQVGTVEDIFRRPTSTMVADFVGMKNLFAVEFSGARARVDGFEIKLGREAGALNRHIAIRPEDLILSQQPLTSSMQNSFAGIVVEVRGHGFFYEIDLAVEKLIFTSVVTSNSFVDLKVVPGDTLYLSFKATAVHIL